MTNQIAVQVWEHNRVRKLLPSLPPLSREAYKDFVSKFSQGYYLLGGEPVADSPGKFSCLLQTGEHVIYRVVESEVIIERIIKPSAFPWNLWAKFISTLDNIGRIMTIQQILSMLYLFKM